MENAVKLSLALGEESPDGGSGTPVSPLDASMKESTRPTLTATIAEMVRLRKLTHAASESFLPYNAHGPEEK